MEHFGSRFLSHWGLEGSLGTSWSTGFLCQMRNGDPIGCLAMDSSEAMTKLGPKLRTPGHGHIEAGGVENVLEKTIILAEFGVRARVATVFVLLAGKMKRLHPNHPAPSFLWSHDSMKSRKEHLWNGRTFVHPMFFACERQHCLLSVE